jgi:hypothetical protein
VGEAVDVAGFEDESSAQLEGIAAEFVLMMAGGAGPLAALEIVAAEKVEEVGFAEVGEFVGLPVLVDEKREVDFGFFLEKACVAGIAETDSGKGGVFFAEGWPMLAQLRDVFAAEDSTVVAEKDNDSRSGFPEGAEADGIAKGVGKNDVGEALAEGFVHEGNDWGKWGGVSRPHSLESW